VNLDEVMEWQDFNHNGTSYDLSHLNSHKVTYTHSTAGKPDIIYDFWVTYSFHCFTKDYANQCLQTKAALMYHAPKESRPFCFARYDLSKTHLKSAIETLDKLRVIHAGYESYATSKIVNDDGSSSWYFIPFKVYKHAKKFRIHVMSAYPMKEEPGKGKVGFFTIAHCLKTGKALPKPHK
jgi:hypothetical protein